MNINKQHLTGCGMSGNRFQAVAYCVSACYTNAMLDIEVGLHLIVYTTFREMRLLPLSGGYHISNLIPAIILGIAYCFRCI